MPSQHLMVFYALLMVSVCAAAVKAYSSLHEKFAATAVPDLKSSSYSWSGGFVSSQFKDHHRLPSNIPQPAESSYNHEDAGKDNRLNEANENDFSPRGRKPQGRKSGLQKHVPVTRLPGHPQSRKPSLGSHSSLAHPEDVGHPSWGKEMVVGQMPTDIPRVDGPIDNLASLHAAGAFRKPSSAESRGVARLPGRLSVATKPVPGSWKPNRHYVPGSGSSWSAANVPRVLHSTARWPGVSAQSSLPFDYRSAVGSGMTWGDAGIAPFPYAWGPTGPFQHASYSSAGQTGLPVDPYGLTHGGRIFPVRYVHIPRDPYGAHVPSKSRASMYQLPFSTGLVYDGHLGLAGLTRGDLAHRYVLPRPHRDQDWLFSVPIGPSEAQSAQAGFYGEFFPTRYHHRHGGDVIQTKTSMEHGRVVFSQSNYSPFGARAVPSSIVLAPGSQNQSRQSLKLPSTW
ncbi:hypothetical protein GN956_G3604 [Arapaima gigas]